MIPHLKTSSTLTLTLSTGTPITVTTTHCNFPEILEIVQNSQPSQETDDYIKDLMKPVNALRKAIQLDEATFEITEYGELICKVEGFPYQLDSSLASHIVTLYKQNGDINPLLKFVLKLSRNPRKEVAQELWKFISVCGLTLTEEGNFLAYKNVNTDFTSAYDNKTDNSPGRVLSMPRQAVEYDPNKTCSSGLHFAAWGYLSSYASGRKTVLLSISPEDVVSIPTDYNNMKGRACRYKVLREVDQPEELKDLVLYREKSELVDTYEEDSSWIRWTKADRKQELDYPPRVNADTIVTVRFKDGSEDTDEAALFYWAQSIIKPTRIVAYKIHP